MNFYDVRFDPYVGEWPWNPDAPHDEPNTPPESTPPHAEAVGTSKEARAHE